MDNVRQFADEINRYMQQRERLDLKAVHVRLMDKYSLVLTNTFSLENGKKDYGEDFEILCGESPAGKFRLYDDGLYIVFDVDKPDGTSVHWHPADLEEAINDTALFMQGNCKC